VLGASMGGLISLYTALRLPETFGRVLSQSGAFGLDVSGRDLIIFDLIRRQEQALSTRIWMDVGRYEFLHPFNERMRDLLMHKGYDLAYRAYNGGHNYTSWRNNVWRGLEWLFPPAESRQRPA
jgi:enterochelin esterase-like enzyme